MVTEMWVQVDGVILFKTAVTGWNDDSYDLCYAYCIKHNISTDNIWS